LLYCWITYGNIREFNRRRGTQGFVAHLLHTKDSNLVVVFGENAAAVLGLAIALTALVLAQVTGDPRYDAAGTLLVGVVLIGVAVFLAVEIKSLLAGESADPQIAEALRDEVESDGRFHGVLNVITIQQGPGEVLVAAKVRLDESLDTRGLVTAINELERRLKARCSEIRWLFIEPDDAE
jgi:divalent metal cation (Fe/Co/Zn/Cd) transporter